MSPQIPQPCGTPAAYRRHRRKGEEACAKCKKARSEYTIIRASVSKPARQINPLNAECTAMDKLLAENPPIIHWAKNNHGVLVAVYVDDPHMDSAGMGSRTAEVRARETPLLAAARRDI